MKSKPKKAVRISIREPKGRGLNFTAYRMTAEAVRDAVRSSLRAKYPDVFEK